MQNPTCREGHTGSAVEQLYEDSDVFRCHPCNDTFLADGYTAERRRLRAEQLVTAGV